MADELIPYDPEDYPYTPVTDRMERGFGDNPSSSALTHAVQLARALEAERFWLVQALLPFATLDKSVNSDRWAIRPELCEHARKVIADLMK